MSVLQVSSADQYLIASGDTPLLDVYKALPEGLFPPFPPVELPGGLGGLLERGGFAQTFFMGSEVLGLRFKSPKGHTVQAGGLTVKNVQGYDLVRPFIGSFGTMGKLMDATLRLRPGRASVFLRRKGELGEPAVQPRFLWQESGWVYAFHFGHPKEMLRFSETFGGEEVKEPLDYTPIFSEGMGVGAGNVLDLRFGWANGAAKPEMPELYQRLVEAL